MRINMFQNASFENEGQLWTTYGVSPQNQVLFLSTGGVGNTGCVKMTGNGTRGTMKITQTVFLKPGTYSISFAGKRTGPNDPRLEVVANGMFVRSPGYAEDMWDGADYITLSFIFSVSGASDARHAVEVSFVNDSYGQFGSNTVWFDNVALMVDIEAEDTYWAMGYISVPQTFIRKEPTFDSGYWDKFEQGTPIGIKPLNYLDDWYLTTYGQNPTEPAYVSTTNIGNIIQTMAWYNRIVEVARFYVGKTKSDLHLIDKWCQSFVNVCVAQAGLADYNPWVTLSNAKDVWEVINQVSYPSKGCIVFTKNQAADTVSHCALIVSDVADNGDFDVIEGDYNGSSYVTERPEPMNIGNDHIVGFGRPFDEA